MWKNACWETMEGETSEWTEGPMDGRMDGQIDWMDGQLDGQVDRCVDGWTGGWSEGWMNEWIDRQMVPLQELGSFPWNSLGTKEELWE